MRLIEDVCTFTRRNHQGHKGGVSNAGHVRTVLMPVAARLKLSHMTRLLLVRQGIDCLLCAVLTGDECIGSIDLRLSNEFRYYKPGLQTIPVREDTDYKTITGCQKLRLHTPMAHIVPHIHRKDRAERGPVLSVASWPGLPRYYTRDYHSFTALLWSTRYAPERWFYAWVCEFVRLCTSCVAQRPL